jgi:hypothetical protein
MVRPDASLVRPVECGSLRRLGAPHDGGYVVPADAITRAALLLSFGVETDWRFERDAVALNPRLRVEAYDPSVGRKYFAERALRTAASVPLRVATLNARRTLTSVRKLRASIDYFVFFAGRHRHHRQRVWHNGDRGSVSLDTALERAGATRPLSVFAKIDIEGSEYRVLPRLCERAELFTGLVVEFHHLDICAAAFNEQMAALRETFEVVHVHGNNYGDLTADRSLPLSLEVSFVHRALCDSRPEPYGGPLPRPGLDAPNDPGRRDYVIDLQSGATGPA